MAQQFDMFAIARKVLLDNGFEPDMPPDLERTIPARDPLEGERDLRMLPWSSIDNEISPLGRQRPKRSEAECRCHP